MRTIGFLKILAGLSFILSGDRVLAQDRLYFARYVEAPNGQKELASQGYIPGRTDVLDSNIEEIRYPEAFIEHEGVSTGWVVELRSKRKGPVLELLEQRRVKTRRLVDDGSRDEEVVTLVNGGPPENRIDLVFMGDGYTSAERDKFFSDMRRLTKEMFDGKTFHSYLPIFNVHAVFKPSQDSGIGKNNTPKNTAYGLYRQGNTLRAIYVSKPGAVDQSCSKAPGCDYPIVVGNDPYYGGLGGRFSITTSSPQSGSVVLRHELGHSVGLVGEEYDGGGYYGANHSSSLTSVSWKHWLSGELSDEPSVAHYVDWMWKDLKLGPFSLPFRSDGQWSFVAIHFGAAGIETEHDLRLSLDGQNIPIQGLGHSDRDFFEVDLTHGLSVGSHEIKFLEGTSDGNNILTDLTVHEFAMGYHFDEGYINAFPVFSRNTNREGFRPTHHTCLMRRMKSDKFCSVCQENNWLKFFKTVSMIDGIDTHKENGLVEVKLRLPALGQFRKPLPLPDEHVEIQWFKSGTEVPELANQFNWSMPEHTAAGAWTVKVHFRTAEVRKDDEKLLTASRTFSI